VPRQPRIEVPDTIFHVCARGRRGVGSSLFRPTVLRVSIVLSAWAAA